MTFTVATFNGQLTNQIALTTRLTNQMRTELMRVSGSGVVKAEPLWYCMDVLILASLLSAVFVNKDVRLPRGDWIKNCVCVSLW